MTIINRVVHNENLEYVISGRMKYEGTPYSEIREAAKQSLGDGTHPIAQFISCFTELVRDAEGDTDLILRKNANDDYVLLVDALDQFGDEIFIKSPAGKEAPISQRYPNGIYEYGILRLSRTRDISEDRAFYFNILSTYAAVAVTELHSVSAEGYVFEMIYETSDKFGGLHDLNSHINLLHDLRSL